MARNIYTSQGNSVTTQNYYEDLVVQALKMYGQDTYYIRREKTDLDEIFGEDPVSEFPFAYNIEMYVQNVDGFDGEGELFTKFGIEIRDQATFVVSRRIWQKNIGDEEGIGRPHEGDLIYLPLSNSMFQIMRVAVDEPFYQLSNLPTYKLYCELFEYNDENFSTGIDEIDVVEEDAFRQILYVQDSATGAFEIGETILQITTNGTIQAEVIEWNSPENKLSVIHVGSLNGEFMNFEADGVVTGQNTGTVRTIISIDEQLTDFNATNKQFAEEALDIIDFTVENPFGEIQH